MPRQLTQAEGRQGTAAGPVIHVAGEQQQLTLPRMLWPAGCDRGQGAPLFFEKIDKKQANELIAAFGGHPLGGYNRSFGDQAWGLAIDGQAVAVTVSGSTVGKTSAGYSRYQVVDLARIARHPVRIDDQPRHKTASRDDLSPPWKHDRPDIPLDIIEHANTS